MIRFDGGGDHDEWCFCLDKEQRRPHPESNGQQDLDDAAEDRKTSVRWADWEGVAQLKHVKQVSELVWPEHEDEECCEPESLGPVTEVKTGLSSSPSDVPPVLKVTVEPLLAGVVDLVKAPVSAGDKGLGDCGADLPDQSAFDTLQAHQQLLRDREEVRRLRMRESEVEHDNPFRPEGELAKEAVDIVNAIKEGRQAITPEPQPRLVTISAESAADCSQIDGHSPGSTAMGSPDEMDIKLVTSTTRSSELNGATKEAAVVQVQRGVIVTSKTDTVEHVVIPEKAGSCCGGCSIT